MKRSWPVKPRMVGVLCFGLILLLIPSTKVDAILLASNDNKWIPVNSMLIPRAGLAAAVVGEKIYAIGGYNGTHYLSTVEEYNPATDTWRLRAQMPTARNNFAAVEVNGKIYAIGGSNETGHLASIEVYDHIFNTWEKLDPMEISRTEFVAVTVEGQIYVIGGRNTEGVLSSVLQYDPVTESWKTRSSIPTPRFGMAAAIINGTIYVIGGRDDGGQLAIVEAYDPILNTWDTNRAPMSGPRQGFAVVTVGGRLYAVGGRREYPIIDYSRLYTGEYDPGIDIWQNRSAIPMYSEAEYIAAVTMAGKIYALGGQVLYPVARWIANVWKYDPPFYDTDNDGLADDDELGLFLTNPFKADTNSDGDRLPDFWEIMYGSNSSSIDTDGDGLTDGEEVITYRTNVAANDTDQDDLTDGDEVRIYGTNPLDKDTDGDRLWDGIEVNETKTDPLIKDAPPDFDGDGLLNGEEEVYGTNLSNPDTDGDGLKDGDEIRRYGTNATKSDIDADTDNDGLTNVEEVDEHGTNPFSPDSDGDGLEDGTEIAGGTYPNNPDSDNDFWRDKSDPFPRINNFIFIIPIIGLVMVLGIQQIQRKRQKSALLVNLERDLALSLSRISDVYRKKSELDKTLEYAQQSLMVCEKIGDKIGIAWTLEEIGELYRKKGDMNKALEFNQRCLAIREELEDNELIARSLYRLVSTTIDHGDWELANHYLNHLQQISTEDISPLITQQYWVAKALVLKTSSRSHHQKQAEEIFNQVIIDKKMNSKLSVVVLLNLCELLLTKIRVSNNPEYLRDIQDYIDQIQVIATQTDSYWLLSEIYVLQFKLALLNLNLKDARHFLTQGKQLIEAYEFHQLTPQIISEYDTLLEQLSQWDALIGYKISLSERLKLAAFDKQLLHIIHNYNREIPTNLLPIRINSIQLNQAVTSLPTRPQSLLDKILIKYPPLKYDDISKAIISCLERQIELNIYQLTEEVRKKRGRASRHTIRDRVNQLINQGILEELEEGHGRIVRIIPFSDN